MSAVSQPLNVGQQRSVVITVILCGLGIITALLVGLLLGYFDTVISISILSLVALMLMFVFRQYELIAVGIIGVHVYVDWYLGMRFVGLGITLVLLAILFLVRSPRRPWIFPRTLWLWLPLLVLAIAPADRGLTMSDGFTYYLTVFFAAALTFWLGAVLAHDYTHVRRVLQLLAGFGLLIALHA